ncbi:MAG TPA: hypothetical protein VGG72_15870 [Bryobacteraceae bacterium]|jgi:hypothetical protein
MPAPSLALKRIPVASIERKIYLVRGQLLSNSLQSGAQVAAVERLFSGIERRCRHVPAFAPRKTIL